MSTLSENQDNLDTVQKHDDKVTPQPETQASDAKDQQASPARQHVIGFKIPTIINGRVDPPKGSKVSFVTSSATSIKVLRNKLQSRTKVRRVRIIGDSHMKGLTSNLKQHLNPQFDVFSFTKPGANTNQLLDTLPTELKSLGNKDFLIISTGTNDWNSSTTNINNVITPLMTYITSQTH